MNNTCKLLTAIATLAAFGAEGMQQTPNTWAHEIEAAKCPPESQIAGLLSDSSDWMVSRFASALFGGANLDRLIAPVSPGKPARSLRESLFIEGKILTAHVLVAANMLEVSVPELVQLFLGLDDNNWSSYDHIETGARLIALVAEREGIDSRTILEEIKQQADQNPQQHRYLIGWLTKDHGNFEQILAQHGF